MVSELLVADIGGTYARLAHYAPDGALTQAMRFECARFPTLDAVLRAYAESTATPLPTRAAFAIAGPVIGETVHMVNRGWVFRRADLQAAFGFRHLLLVNDFAAVAAAIPALTTVDIVPLGESPRPVRNDEVPRAPIAVLGPGSGLGVASLVPGANGRYIVLPGEGGHTTLAAVDDRDAAVLARLRARFGHVSAECALSGPGLVHLYQAVCELAGLRITDARRPDEVVAAATAGEAQARTAVELFAGFLGSVAGNLALTVGARGGVYVAGGVLAHLGTLFDAARFRQRFCDKGRLFSWLEDIPTWHIIHPTPAFPGLAVLDADDKDASSLFPARPLAGATVLSPAADTTQVTNHDAG